MIVTVPKVYMSGRYKTDSKIFFPIVGEGPFTANLTKLTGQGKAALKVTQKGGKRFLRIENASFDFNIGMYTSK